MVRVDRIPRKRLVGRPEHQSSDLGTIVQELAPVRLFEFPFVGLVASESGGTLVGPISSDYDDLWSVTLPTETLKGREVWLNRT